MHDDTFVFEDICMSTNIMYTSNPQVLVLEAPNLPGRSDGALLAAWVSSVYIEFVQVQIGYQGKITLVLI